MTYSVRLYILFGLCIACTFAQDDRQDGYCNKDNESCESEFEAQDGGIEVSSSHTRKTTRSQTATSGEVDLFLLGKTGTGKSSTGNTILGRPVFQTSDSGESETFKIQVGWSRRLGRIFKVVDGPGLFETRISRGEAADKFVDDMSQAIMQSPRGFHALVLVLKYGNRFTDEEIKTVETLKLMFGENFIRDYCIIVFTFGELFDMNNKERTFEEWRKDQKGALQALLQECKNRAVLFYNSEPEKHEDQMDALLGLVDGLKSKGVRYTNEIFKKAAATREKFIVIEKAPQLREKILAKIHLLADGLEMVKAEEALSPSVKSILRNLKQDAIDLRTEIAIQDKDTKVLESLKQQVINILENVESHEELLRQKQNTADKEEALAAAKEQYEENLKQMKYEIAKANRRSYHPFIEFFRSIFKAFFGF